jgi:hypothetical protein
MMLRRSKQLCVRSLSVYSNGRAGEARALANTLLREEKYLQAQAPLEALRSLLPESRYVAHVGSEPVMGRFQSFFNFFLLFFFLFFFL